MKIRKQDYIIYIAAAVVIYLVYRKMQTDKKTKEERNETLQISEQISEQQPGAFNPAPWGQRLKSDFGSYTADTALYEELMKLSDQEIRQIWEYYDVRLKAQDPQKGKTLGLAVYDAYSFTRSFTFGWDWTYHAKLFYDRLKTIGLP